MAEKNPELQKQAAPGGIAIKGAITKTDLEGPVVEPSPQAIRKQDLRDQEKGWGSDETDPELA